MSRSRLALMGSISLLLVGGCRSKVDPSTQPAKPEPARATTTSSFAPREGLELIGKPAPEFAGLDWLEGGPFAMRDLRGKAVLIRFWLTGCPYCRATAPALVELEERYRARGLVVIGIHHPKSAAAKDPELVKSTAKELGFRFPIATDVDWKTVRAYGVGTTFQRYTSVSFLVDREGKFAFVHDGGEYHRGGGPDHAPCNRAYDALVEKLESVLASSRP